MRTEIAYETVCSLNKYGYHLNWDSIQEFAHADAAITKGHIIEALKKSNIKFNSQLFKDFFNPRGTNYIPFKDHPL